MSRRSGSRGSPRRLVVIRCPQTSCRLPLATTDGRRLFVGVPQASAIVHQRLTFCCGRPGCRGCLTWYPGAPGPAGEDDAGDGPEG